MTTPAEPATGAGDAPDTGSAPQEPATTDAQPPQEPATSATDTTDWQAEAEKWKAQARKHEDRAKASKAALDKANKQAAPKEGEPTPDELKQQLTEANEAREAAETAALQAVYTSTVTRVAAKVGADAEALLDSDSFYQAVGEELGDDFDDDDLRGAVEKVAKEFAKKPRFAVPPAGSSRGGADINGGPPAPTKRRPTSLTEAFSRSLGGQG